MRAASRLYKIPASKWLDLSTCINPNGWPAPSIPPTILQRLPEPNDGLVSAASAYYGCNSVLPVSGVQAAIQALPQLRSFSRVGIVWPGYSEHIRAWQMTGDAVRLIRPQDVDQTLALIDVLIVVNPNNPTGFYFEPKTLLLWHRYLVARGGWLIVDEAIADPTPELSMAKHCPRPGLIVLRSLGKFFGMAGLRTGFVLAERELLRLLNEYLGPWSVSNPARWISRQALKDYSWQTEAIEKLEENTVRLEELLKLNGLTPSGGTHLYQWVKSPRAREVHRSLARRGILTRLFKAPLSLRIGIPGNEAQWKRLAAGLRRVVHRQKETSSSYY